MISTKYDPEADALYVLVADDKSTVAESREVEPGVILDLDQQGSLVGIEVLHARFRARSPIAAE